MLEARGRLITSRRATQLFSGEKSGKYKASEAWRDFCAGAPAEKRPGPRAEVWVKQPLVPVNSVGIIGWEEESWHAGYSYHEVIASCQCCYSASVTQFGDSIFGQNCQIQSHGQRKKRKVQGDSRHERIIARLIKFIPVTERKALPTHLVPSSTQTLVSSTHYGDASGWCRRICDVKATVGASSYQSLRVDQGRMKAAVSVPMPAP
ncbi:hypothetical protein EI94DRAFT_1699643 [Lactarius quietus]|nr:hypothetical protein EI94DRAFT_1699643 [Lactarius quietus]